MIHHGKASSTCLSASTEKVEDKSREEKANIFSQLFFSWTKPLFNKAQKLSKEKKGLESEDLLSLPKMDESSTIFQYIATSTDGKVSHIVRKVMGCRFILASIIKFIVTGLEFTFPLLLRAILEFIEDTQAGQVSSSLRTSWYGVYGGYWLSLLLFVAAACKTVAENQQFHIVCRIGYHVRVALNVSVYKKSLRLANFERQSQTLGELLNLMQVDAKKIAGFVQFGIHDLYNSLIQIFGFIVILYSLIGWPCLVGCTVLVFSIFIQRRFATAIFQLDRDLMQHTDGRVKTTSEAVQGIRCVKMYAWEESFSSIINDRRGLELDVLKKSIYLCGGANALMSTMPTIVAVLSIVSYALMTDTDIKASTLFAAIMVFGQLRGPLSYIPGNLAKYAEAKVSVQRVQKFLELSEIKSRKTDERSTSYNFMEKGSVIVENATIYWCNPDGLPKSFEDKGDECKKNKENDSTKKLSKTGTKNDDDDDDDDDDEIGNMSQLINTAVLTDVNWKVNSGELCAVVGRVGSGKSTLCSTILNETVLQNGGSIHKHGTVAYAAQSPWLLNATIRDNIIFGSPYEEKKYKTIIDVCQLKHDLSLLESGDLTEIGENGINLSGGQKQRVSMARAAYSNADIYILDDPISALDPEVGERLFDECIVQYLKNKTRIFVTNHLNHLEFCDSFVALDNCQVLGQGQSQDMGSSKTSNDTTDQVQRLLEDLNKKKKKKISAISSKGESSDITNTASVDDSKASASSHEEESTKNEQKTARLVTKEERNVGAVSWQIYNQYIKAGGYHWFLFAFGIHILCSVITLMSTGWVSIWVGDAKYERQSRGYYLGIYSSLAAVLSFVTFLRSILGAIFGVRASTKLHGNLLSSILHAPLSFFDTTPTGRILSRFSQDLYSIDFELCDIGDFFIYSWLTVIIALGTMTVVTPFLGIAILPLAYIYVKILNYYRNVSRETKRLHSISNSPVFSHFSETLGGLGTIRAYEQTDRFNDEFEKRIDTNTRAFYNLRSADRWMSLRLELIGASICGLAAFLACNIAITNKSISGTFSSSNFASSAGLSLTYAISLTSALNWLVRSFVVLEAAMNATERVFYYIYNIPQEAPSTTKLLDNYVIQTEGDGDRTLISNTDKNVVNPAITAVQTKGIDTLPSGWPERGNITLTNLNMKYRPETPLIISGLNLAISGGERIGIVGRTGSGKSSLLLTLLRLVEPTLTSQPYDEAPISIDGVDILRIGVSDLRSQIGIVPQSPVLFSGTIRSNLDPFNEYTDDQIWNVLARCGMKDAVIALNKKNDNCKQVDGISRNENYMSLSAPVAEYGNNWSQGQRQLLCLGRVLLKKCRILLLDEATSSVDYETDSNIQRTLREDFDGCTVLIIAHRVNTIMDSDKIVVMRDGKVAEYAPPQDLLSDTTSLFYDIVQRSQSEQNNSLKEQDEKK